MTIHAKSAFGKFEVSLVEHTQDVLDASDGLFGTEDRPSRLGREWCRFFRVTDVEAFQRHLRLACCLHDFGKSNSGFQAAVTSRAKTQPIRHEHLSALLVNDPMLREELAANECNMDVVTVAISGHHLQASHATLGKSMSAEVRTFKILGKGVRDLLALAATACQLEGLRPNDYENDEVWSYEGVGVNAKTSADTLRKRLKRFRSEIQKGENKPLRNLTIAVRAALIVADAAGSGFVRTSTPEKRKTVIAKQLAKCFEVQPFDGGDIHRKVIQPRIHQLNAKFTEAQQPEFEWHDFQENAAQLGPRSLLLAGCGSGKTLAAWRWIQSQADRRPVSRVIFLYPTRATATEGFRDYVSWAPEGSLATGTAAYELQGMFENPEDVRAERDYTPDDRLFAIGYWHRRIFSATVDQFLGFMQHSYRSICLLPMLVDSVVVFDEIHSFDRSLFSAFRRFLQEFDVPALCMTASLPSERTRSLVEDCGLSVFPEKPEQFEDLYERAMMPRYEIQVANRGDVDEFVAKALESGRKVLWVVNTIRRCQEIAQQHNAICYHSGFTLDDRKERHGRVIRDFQKSKGSVLAVTTQVCEMSLDLDAWLLVTEVAPIPSLIQRMGRCNRHAEPGSDLLGHVVVYEPENERPYNEDDLSGVTEFLAAIDGQTVSQLRLQKLLEEHGQAAADPEKYAAFVQSGPWAKAHEESLRDESDFTIQAVLDLHVEQFVSLQKSRQPSDGYLLPAPRWMTEEDDDLPRWLRKVPAELYSSEWGLDRGPVGREFIGQRLNEKVPI